MVSQPVRACAGGMTIAAAMRAVLLTRHGGYDCLDLRDDVCVPQPAAGEVLIRVGAAGVNNTDINTRIGWYSKAVADATDAGAASGMAGAGDDGWSGEAFQFPRIQPGSYRVEIVDPAGYSAPSEVPFDQLQTIVDAVGGKIEIILDGGIKRGTHVLKALALGANACSIGKAYLYGLSAGGQEGVEQIVGKLRDEIQRGMTLMGCRSVKELTKDKVLFR